MTRTTTLQDPHQVYHDQSGEESASWTPDGMVAMPVGLLQSTIRLSARWIINPSETNHAREWIESQLSLSPLLEFEREHCGGQAVVEPLVIS